MCPRGFDGSSGAVLHFLIDVLKKMQVAPFGCNTPESYVEKSSALSPRANPFPGGNIDIRPRDGIEHRAFDDFVCALNDGSGFTGSQGGRIKVLATIGVS